MARRSSAERRTRRAELEVHAAPSVLEQIAQVEGIEGPDTDQEFEEEIQKSLDEEGVDPEETGEVLPPSDGPSEPTVDWGKSLPEALEEPGDRAPEQPFEGLQVVVVDEDGVLDMGRQMPEELHNTLAGVFGDEPLAPPQPPASPDLPPDMPLDLKAPMSDQAEVALLQYIRRSAGAAPRMSSERLDMRVRIAEKWRHLHPKRPGTIAYTNWLYYVDGMTVSAFLASHDRRRARSDLAWDIAHEFVYLQSSAEYAREMAERVEAADAAFDNGDTDAS